jgi:hypothetical protein
MNKPQFCVTISVYILFLFLVSCKGNLEDDWDYFNKHSDTTVNKILDINVDPNDIAGCEKYFLDTMRSHGFSVDNVNFTRGVYFGSDALQKWFTQYKVFRNADRIELHLGCYTDDFLSKYIPNNDEEHKKRKGRITLFLVPTKQGSQAQQNGKPIPNFNLGGLQP